MISIRKILFPTDFSECAKSAEEYAIALAGQFNAEIHLLHVLADLTTMLPDPGFAISLSKDDLAMFKKEAQQRLEKIRPEGFSPPLRVVRALRTGNAFVEILKYAEEARIDLIVIGTHGRSGLVHLLLGSVAEKVVRKAQCPVLTVRPANQQSATTK